MAIRKIVTLGDDTLRKHCKVQEKFDRRLAVLLKDMADTMYKAEGVGLAAPQVGVLRRLFVVDVGEGPVVLVNPEILETSGEQTGSEGCLSIPGRSAEVTRPDFVRVRGLDENGREVEYEAKELFARAILHEYDHLEGVLYTDKVDPSEVVAEEE